MKFWLLLFSLSLIILVSCKKEDEIPGAKYSVDLEGRFNDICSNDADEIILIGTNEDFQPASFCNDFFIVKTNREGNLVWTKKYVIDLKVEPKKILYAGPDEYYIAINNLVEDTAWMEVSCILILKINDAGDITAQNLIKLFGGLMFRDMILAQEGGVIVTGKKFGGENQGVVAKINPSGETEYLRQYPFTFQQTDQFNSGELYLLNYFYKDNDSVNEELYRIDPPGNGSLQGIVAQEGEYAFACFSADQGHIMWTVDDGPNRRLVKTDFANNLIWTTDYQITEDKYYQSWGLKQIGANYFAYGNYGQFEGTFYFIKFDENGNKGKKFRTPLHSYSYPEDLLFTELSDGHIVFVQPVDISANCTSSYCSSLQIFY